MNNNYATTLANNTIISGNSINIDTCCDVSEIKANIKVSEFESKRIWGQILNCNNLPVPNTLIKLIKVSQCNSGLPNYQGVAHTISDCDGFYQFDVCDDSAQYKIIVSKAATGGEAVHDGPEGLCNSCNTPNYCDLQNMPNPNSRCNPNPGLYPCEQIMPQQNCGCSHPQPHPRQNCGCSHAQHVCKKPVCPGEHTPTKCTVKSNYTPSNQCGCNF